MGYSDIKRELGENWLKFEESYQRAISSDNELIMVINGHLTSNPGKMLRPLLSLLSADCCGKINNESIICAVTSEIMHTASLMHDDVADNSDLRRGVPTIKKLFSPGASVLMGDYWLSKAISLILNDNTDYKILQCFAKALEDLSYGELLQMKRTEDLQINEKEYKDIIAKKTSSLFIASVKSGVLSVCPGDKAEILDAFEKFGYHLGIAFQIKDDILDYSPGKDIGKPTCADITERKLTLPLIGAMNNALLCGSHYEEIDSLIKRVGSIDKTTSKADIDNIVRDVMNFVKQHDGISYAERELDRHIGKSVESIEIIPDSPSKQMLIKIVKSLTL